MGCDIHLRVEYRAPAETLAVVDGEVKVVPAEPRTDSIEFAGHTITVERTALEIGASYWVPAEDVTPKTPDTAKRDQWVNIVDKDKAVRDSDGRETDERVLRSAEDLADAQAEYDDLPDQWVRYEDQWYRGRNYELFSALVPGLRGDASHAEFEERGWPDDANPVNQEYMEGWSSDGHSHSHQTLAELLEVDWEAKLAWEYTNQQGKVVEGGDGEWIDMLARMRALADEKCDGDQTAVRILYFFDN